MIKAILFDLDGVVLKKRERFFSERLAEKQEMSIEKIIPFFKNEYKQIVVGKLDLKDSLEKYLPEWGWSEGVEKFLDFWFTPENNIDEQVVNLANRLKVNGYKIYLASDHSAERAENLLLNEGLGKYFDGDFFSGRVGYTKEEKDFFFYVSDVLKLDPSEILFIDDDNKNVEIAKSAGFVGIHFLSVEQLKKSLEENNVII